MRLVIRNDYDEVSEWAGKFFWFQINYGIEYL